jgi:hypothetical protein
LNLNDRAGDRARVRLNDGVSVAVLIDALLRSPLKNRDAVKLISRALRSGDFIVTSDFGSPSHLKYFYAQIDVRRCSRHDVARHHCQHGHPLATDARRQLIGPETAPGSFLRHEKLPFFLGGLRRVATYALARAGRPCSSGALLP